MIRSRFPLFPLPSFQFQSSLLLLPSFFQFHTIVSLFSFSSFVISFIFSSPPRSSHYLRFLLKFPANFRFFCIFYLLYKTVFPFHIRFVVFSRCQFESHLLAILNSMFIPTEMFRYFLVFFSYSNCSTVFILFFIL